MECDKCSKMLSEYIDGRLSVDQSAAIAAHLEDCKSCREIEADLRATISLVSSLERKAAPSDFAEAVTGRLERRLLIDGPAPRRRSRLAPWTFTGFGLAAAAVVLAALFVKYYPPEEPLLPPREPIPAAQPLADSDVDDLVDTVSVEEREKTEPTAVTEAAELRTSGEAASRSRAGASLGVDSIETTVRADGPPPAEPEKAPVVSPTGARIAESAFAKGTPASTVGESTTKAESAPDEMVLAAEMKRDVQKGVADKLRALGYLGGPSDAPAEPAEVASAASVPADAPSEDEQLKAGVAGGRTAVSAPVVAVAAAADKEHARKDVVGRAADLGEASPDTAAFAEVAAKTPEPSDADRIPTLTFVAENGAVDATVYFANSFRPAEKQLPPEGNSDEGIRKALSEANFQVIELSDDKAVLQGTLVPDAIVISNQVLLSKRGLSQQGRTPEIVMSQISVDVKKSQGIVVPAREAPIWHAQLRQQLVAGDFVGVGQKPLVVQYIFIRPTPETSSQPLPDTR